MIIHDLDIFGSDLRPSKTNPVLIVDADGKLSLPVALEGFQPVSRRDSEIFQASGDFELTELSPGDRFKFFKSLYPSASGQRLRLFRFE